MLCFLNQRNITIQDIYIKVTSFNLYLNFRDKFLSKIQVSEMSHSGGLSWSQTTYLKKKISLIVFRYNFYQVLPVVHNFSLTIMTYLKIFVEIKSFNAKQCLARLFPPPVNLRE